MRTSTKLAAGLVALVLVSPFVSDDEPTTAGPAAVEVPVDAAPVDAAPVDAAPDDAAPDAAAPGGATPGEAASGPAAPAPDPARDLLQAAGGGDGDSWRDTAGREYRLGLVNAPETQDCFGAAATAERMRLTAGGFRADVYTTDGYGRSVAVVTLADGTNLNVHLARHGFADDRYLERFRSENPGLAAQLDAAFAAARSDGAGLWGACSAPPAAVAAPAPAAAPAAAPATGACHPDYVTCIPVQGDGSGRGQANDLDCGSIGQRVQLRQAGVDPYRLDADGDGFGCDPG